MICDVCKKNIPEGRNYCPSCVVARNLGHSNYSGVKPSKTKIFMNVLLIFLFIAIAGGIYYFVTTAEREYTPDNNQEQNNFEPITLNQIADKFNVVASKWINEFEETNLSDFDNFQLIANEMNSQLIIVLAFNYYQNQEVKQVHREIIFNLNDNIMSLYHHVEVNWYDYDLLEELIYNLTYMIILNIADIIVQLNGFAEGKIFEFDRELSLERNGIELTAEMNLLIFQVDLSRRITLN